MGKAVIIFRYTGISCAVVLIVLDLIFAGRSFYAVAVRFPRETKAAYVLREAVLNGDCATITRILNESPGLAQRRDTNGQTILHLAARDKSQTAVQCLGAVFSAGGLVNEKDRAGNTPLIMAASYGYPEFAALLLSHGADPSAADREGLTPLHQAASRPGANPEKFLKVTQSLIDSGAEVDKKNREGDTPLHYAAWKSGIREQAEMLIKGGADVNAQNNYGHIPLHRAVHYSHLEVAKVLLAKGADVNALDAKEQTPLHQAASAILGPDVTPPNDATDSELAATAQWLIDNGAKVNARDVEGNTPLHQAVYYGNLEVVTLLLKAGADANAKNDAGRTPIFGLFTTTLPVDKPGIFAALSNKGADFKIVDNNGVGLSALPRYDSNKPLFDELESRLGKQ